MYTIKTDSEGITYICDERIEEMHRLKSEIKDEIINNCKLKKLIELYEEEIKDKQEKYEKVLAEEHKWQETKVEENRRYYEKKLNEEKKACERKLTEEKQWSKASFTLLIVFMPALFSYIYAWYDIKGSNEGLTSFWNALFAIPCFYLLSAMISVLICGVWVLIVRPDCYGSLSNPLEEHPIITYLVLYGIGIVLSAIWCCTY